METRPRPAEEPVRLMVVDDHPLIAIGLASAIERTSAGDIAVVGTAFTVGEAVAAIESLRPDVVVSDLMFGRVPAGISLARAIRRMSRPPAIIIFSAYAVSSYAAQAMDIGVAGYVLKGDPPSDLVHAIHAAAAGRKCFRSDIRRLADEAPPEPTPREMAIIRLVCDGRTNDEIGAELGLTAKTVEGVLGKVFRRYGVAGRGQMDSVAVRHGWLLGERLPLGNGGPAPRGITRHREILDSSGDTLRLNRDSRD